MERATEFLDEKPREILKNKTHIGADGYDMYADTRELSLQLSAQMIHLSGKTKSISEAYHLANDSLVSGRAFKVFNEMCELQGGRIEALPFSKNIKTVVANENGYIKDFNVEKIGIAGITIHAGRQMTTDKIHPTSGIEFHKKIGDLVNKNDIIYTIHGDEPDLFSIAEDVLKLSYSISGNKPEQHNLIKKILH